MMGGNLPAICYGKLLPIAQQLDVGLMNCTECEQVAGTV